MLSRWFSPRVQSDENVMRHRWKIAPADAHQARRTTTVNLVRPFAVLAAAIGTWRRRSRSRADLAAMDQRMLNDLGLSRSHATVEASKPFWRT